MHLSLQYGETALMLASQAGHMECVQVLLDKGAKVNMQNKVSCVIIHCVRAMYPSNELPCCLMTESSTSLDEATCKISMMVTSFTNGTYTNA